MIDWCRLPSTQRLGRQLTIQIFFLPRILFWSSLWALACLALIVLPKSKLYGSTTIVLVISLFMLCRHQLEPSYQIDDASVEPPNPAPNTCRHNAISNNPPVTLNIVFNEGVSIVVHPRASTLPWIFPLIRVLLIIPSFTKPEQGINHWSISHFGEVCKGMINFMRRSQLVFKALHSIVSRKSALGVHWV